MTGTGIDVVVIGSLNHDVVVEVDAAPRPGETVLARTLKRTNGGKGGNQAVAAARAGAAVRMVSAVGTDAEGDMQVTDLRSWGIDVSGITRQPDLPTALALIWVTPDGENSIIVTPGAKDRVTPEAVLGQAGDLGGPVRVVLAQSEVGAAVSDAAAQLARQLGARFILSCGPVVVPARETLGQCDPIVLNAGEARDLLAGLGADDRVPEIGLAQALLSATGAQSVVVTLGSQGSQLVQPDQAPLLIPAAKAERVVDTTGAGDTYCGVVAARLAAGDPLVDACRQAGIAAAAAVGWMGAQPTA